MGDQQQRVFLSYRRGDELAAMVVGRLHDHLAERYGADNVFMDVDTIPPGVPFDDYLAEAVSKASVLIAVIGKEWMSLLGARKGTETDFVRVEIESALESGIPVVPLLIGDTSMPQSTELPRALAPLSRRNSFRLDPGRDFKAHVSRLTDDLDRLTGVERRRVGRESEAPKRNGRKRQGFLAPTMALIMMVAVCVGAFIGWSKWRASRLPTDAGAGIEPTVETKPMASRGKDDITGTGIEMVWCPAGSFSMGSPDREAQRGHDEKPHQVQLEEPFWIARYEVTQKQWQEIMGDNPSSFKDSGPDAPVEMVNWEDAMEFCRKLTGMEREDGHLPDGWHYTLPTEEQWEYACRAGTDTPFYFGASLNGTRANSAGNSPYGINEAGPYLMRTIPTGSYKPNSWGLYDMHGNVSEWCLTIYEQQYDLPAAARPVIPDPRALRVYRGGSFHDYPSDCRSAHRFSGYPDFREFYLGFRPVRTRIE